MNTSSIKVLYSIPRTGTRFVMGLLSHVRADFKQQHIIFDAAPVEPLVVPVRNPLHCWLSWSSEPYSWFSEGWFFAAWSTLILQTINHPMVYYFPLDTDDREGVVRGLLEFVDRKEADVSRWRWEPEGKNLGHRDTEVPRFVRDRMQALIDWYERVTWPTNSKS